MKRTLNIFLSIITTVNTTLFLTACSIVKVNFVITSESNIRSLNYLKYDYKSFDSRYLLSTVEGLFHSTPNDQQSTNEVLGMSTVNDLQGLIVKEMNINATTLDFSKKLQDVSSLNQQVKNLAKQSTQVIDKTTNFWYGVAKDIFVLNYGETIDNNKNRKLKEFIIQLRHANPDDKSLLYKDANGIERWQDRPALWHDGKNVTAHDFVNSVKYVLDKNNGSENTNFLTLKENLGINFADEYLKNEVSIDDLGIKAIGDDLLYINLYSGFNTKTSLLDNLIGKINTTSAMLPSRKDIIEKYGDRWGTSKNTFLGNGAFQIYSADFDQDTVFTKNLAYWDRERITANNWKYKVVKSPIASAILFESGESVISNIPTELLDRFTSNVNLRQFLFQGMATKTSNYIAFNDNVPKFANEKGKYLRNAIQYIIDRYDVLLSQNDSGAIPGDTLTTLLSNNNGQDLSFRETLVDSQGEPLYFVDTRNNNEPKEKVPLAYYGYNQRVFYDSVQVRVNRTDRLKKVDVAQKFYKDYIKLNSEIVTLNLLYEVQEKAQKMLLLLKQTIESNFPNIKINLIGQSKGVFLSKLAAGEYDLVFNATESDISDPFSYLNILAKPYIEQEKLRYDKNPTGKWSFYDFIKRFTNLDDLLAYNSFFREFNVTQEEFLWLHALFTPYNEQKYNFAVDGLEKSANKNIDDFEKLNKILVNNNIGTNVLGQLFNEDSGYKLPGDNDLNVKGLGGTFPAHISFRIYAILEAIIKLESPVIILINGTSGWAARRVLGYAQGSSGAKPEVQWSYNCANKDSKSLFPLKGCDAFSKPDLVNI